MVQRTKRQTTQMSAVFYCIPQHSAPPLNVVKRQVGIR